MARAPTPPNTPAKLSVDWDADEKQQLTQLRASGKSCHECSILLQRPEIQVAKMDKSLSHLRTQLNDKVGRFLTACSDSQASVNLTKVTKAMQPHFRKFESIPINLSDGYWQPIITEIMAESLHSLNFQPSPTPSTVHSRTLPLTFTEHLDVPHREDTPQETMVEAVIDEEDEEEEEEEEVEEEEVSHESNDDDSLPDAALQLLNRTSVSQVGVSEGSDDHDDAKYRTETDPDDITSTQVIDERKESEYAINQVHEAIEEEEMIEIIEVEEEGGIIGDGNDGGYLMEGSEHGIDHDLDEQLHVEHKRDSEGGPVYRYDGDDIDDGGEEEEEEEEEEDDHISEIHPDIWTQIEREVSNQQRSSLSPGPNQQVSARSNHGFASSTTFLIHDELKAPSVEPVGPIPSENHMTHTLGQWVTMNVRWKTNSNFVVNGGVNTTQITKRGSSYSSIYTLEPMMARKFRYTFILSHVQERGKPWMGIGIISSKCPYFQSGRWPQWHASNRYSVGWYYGQSIWHDHNTMKEKYGGGRWWKSGDQIEMTVDCRTYTLSYKLNGRDLGIAVKDFNKLLDSSINDRYYAILSIQRGPNSIQLFEALRCKEHRSRSINDSVYHRYSSRSNPNPNSNANYNHHHNMEEEEEKRYRRNTNTSNHDRNDRVRNRRHSNQSNDSNEENGGGGSVSDRNWKSFFKFNRKSKGNTISMTPQVGPTSMRRMQSEMMHDHFSIEEAAGARTMEHLRSKSEDAKTFMRRMKEAEESKSEEHSRSSRHEELVQELERIKAKYETQKRMMIAQKQRCESTVSAYRKLENEQQSTLAELEKWKEEARNNSKDLNLSRGAMHELKKMNIGALHELQSNLFGALTNVQKAISLHYESKYECRICMANEKDTVLIPCGHFLCGQCALKVSECPMCRAQIGRTLQLN